MKRKLDSTEHKAPELVGKKIVLATTKTKTDLSGELGKTGSLDGDIDITEGFGITVDDFKKLKNDAKIFIKNSDLLHSEELYDFEKIEEKQKELSEDEINTIFSMLEKERNELIKYSKHLPLWAAIVLRKFLDRNYQRVVSNHGLGRLDDLLKTRIRGTSSLEQNNAMRYHNGAEKIKREAQETHKKKFGRVNRRKLGKMSGGVDE